jgi:hypothetical protein
MRVGAGISWMSITPPSRPFAGKPIKIAHSSPLSLEKAFHAIKEADGTPSLETASFCIPRGLPLLLLLPSPQQGIEDRNRQSCHR